ncbi:hypothetical protein F4823DRAFT_278068 [Ustulina deusta]|nr:hypothetical protein F4823DRAFT_278068 [Ustulina deusta]
MESHWSFSLSLLLYVRAHKHYLFSQAGWVCSSQQPCFCRNSVVRSSDKPPPFFPSPLAWVSIPFLTGFQSLHQSYCPTCIRDPVEMSRGKNDLTFRPGIASWGIVCKTPPSNAV